MVRDDMSDIYSILLKHNSSFWCRPTLSKPVKCDGAIALTVNNMMQNILENSRKKEVRFKMGTEKGVKLDNGKLRLGLVLGGFAGAIKELGAIGTFGANKYTDNGWQSVPNGVERYKDALFRHLFAWLSGEEFDEESGYRHLSHALWNIAAICTLTHKKEYLTPKKFKEDAVGPLKFADIDTENFVGHI